MTAALDEHARSPPRTGRGELVALLLILLVAAALRLPRLATNPPGLIPDEAMLAYDAWSIGKTGRDQYGEWMPLFPRSAGRLCSMYTYALVPSVAALGLTEVGTRVPAVLAGLLTVGLLSRLVRRAGGVAAGLCASALLAVSPWHVLISRTGHEWCFLPTVTLVTVLLVLRALEARGSWLWAGLAAGLCLYTYTPIRMSLPLILVGLAGLFHRELWSRRAAVGGGMLVAAIVALPVVLSALGPEGMARLAAVSEKGGGEHGLLGGYLARYAASFSPDFFLRGADEPELHRLRSTGLLYGFEVALLLVGVGSVLWRRERVGLAIGWWWVAAPLAVAIHRDCPDPILLVTQLPMPQALAGLGAGALLGFAVSRGSRFVRAAAALGTLLAVLLVARMASDLYRTFPVYAAPAWGHGVRDAVQHAEALRAGAADVVVEPGGKFLFSEILFYARMDPSARQAEVQGMEGLTYRSVVGPYRIGPVLDLARAPGEHVVWTTRPEELRDAPGVRSLATVPWPDGRDHYALLSVPALPRRLRRSAP